MTTSTARVETAHASRYLQQLCKHFAHKLPTTFDPTAGRIDFPIGRVDLTADPGALVMRLTPTTDDQDAALRDVVVRHLERFAFRETLLVDWSATPVPPQDATTETPTR